MTITCGSLVSAQALSTAITRFCEQSAESAARGTLQPIIFNRFGHDGPLTRLEGTTNKDGAMNGARRFEVTDKEATSLCAQGYAIDVLTITQRDKSAATQKAAVDPLSSLPPNFLIGKGRICEEVEPGPVIVCEWKTYGSFWVPNAMPSGHTFQVLDFTVTPTNYENSGPDTHFAAMTQVVSDTNFGQDFDAKGAIFFSGGSKFCGLSQTTTTSMLQSWDIRPTNPVCASTDGNCRNPVFGQFFQTAAYVNQPSTCSVWNTYTAKRFLVGSNIWQQSRYLRCAIGGACPEFTSPDVDSTTPYFRTGQAGVAFVLAGATPNVQWHLEFTNVSSFTSP